MSDFESVKARADIVDVVGQYVTLQRAGRQFKACCPFHNEKTPSFYVNPERQSWHCFGSCSTGGDVFSFIERKENMTPVEALRLLAERYGVALERGRRREHEPATNRLVEANEAAAQFFHNLLLNAPAAAEARAYLERRGLDAATIQAFELGYAADTWESLREHLAGRGFSLDEQLAAGLLSEGERSPYDRFRGRVMFPIRDERGRVIGFGGRVLGDGLPKYLNTPQTALFDKGATLYALDRAKDAVRAASAAVVVEGYMDAIAAHQHGITNVVATLGTALTERHVTLLKRYARQVILSMDADAAGIEAALRGEELVRNAAPEDGDPAQVVVDWRSLVRVQAAAPVEVRVFTVPQGKDPDEAIRADPAAFRELTRHAVPPFEFRLRHALASIDRDNPRERLALADRLLPLVAGVSDRAVQAQYLARLAQATAIAEDVLAGRMRDLAGARKAAALPLRERAQASRPAGRAPGIEQAPTPAARPLPIGAGTGGEEHVGVAETPSSPSVARLPRGGEEPSAGSTATPPGSTGTRGFGGLRTETSCLRLLLTYAGLRGPGLALEDDLLTDGANRALFLAWRAAPADQLDAALDEAGREHLTRVLAERVVPYPDEASVLRAFEDMVARLRLRRLEDRTRLLAATLAESGSGGDAERTRRALVALAEGGAGEVEDEEAARLLRAMHLGLDRHALEVGLRTRGARRDVGTGA